MSRPDLHSQSIGNLSETKCDVPLAGEALRTGSRERQLKRPFVGRGAPLRFRLGSQLDRDLLSKPQERRQGDDA